MATLPRRSPMPNGGSTIMMQQQQHQHHMYSNLPQHPQQHRNIRRLGSAERLLSAPLSAESPPLPPPPPPPMGSLRHLDVQTKPSLIV